MPHIEDLRVGDMIVITAYLPDEKDMRWGKPVEWSTDGLDGIPLKVLAVSPPFVLCEDPQGNGVIDIRRSKLSRVTKQYAKAFRRVASMAEPAEADPVEPNSSFVFGRTCPRCGGPMRQVMTLGKRGWRNACKNCGHEIEDCL